MILEHTVGYIRQHLFCCQDLLEKYIKIQLKNFVHPHIIRHHFNVDCMKCSLSTWFLATNNIKCLYLTLNIKIIAYGRLISLFTWIFTEIYAAWSYIIDILQILHFHAIHFQHRHTYIHKNIQCLIFLKNFHANFWINWRYNSAHVLRTTRYDLRIF